MISLLTGSARMLMASGLNPIVSTSPSIVEIQLNVIVTIKLDKNVVKVLKSEQTNTIMYSYKYPF